MSPGPLTAATLTSLAEAGFDQVPVVDHQRDVVLGLATLAGLTALLEAGQPLTADDPSIAGEERYLHSGHTISAFDLLDSLAAQPARLVVIHGDCEQYGPREFLAGIITLSDLNRLPIKVTVYEYLTELELQLSSVVARVFSCPWDWIGLLPEEQQVRVLGYWELSKRRNVDVGPLSATTLSNLVTIATSSPQMREVLGYQSKNAASKAMGSIPELRNRVMHPVRPLILDARDASKLATHLRTVLALLATTAKPFPSDRA